MSTPTIYISRRIEWDSAHRVLRHESKCATLHGHRYVANIIVSADKLDGVGRIVDFGVVKQRVGGWVDAVWDHTTIVNREDVELLAFCRGQAIAHGHRAPYEIDGEPTAENIADVLKRIATHLLADTGVRVIAVEVFETPNCSATVRDPETFNVRASLPAAVVELP